jgi:hypothetical protein
MGGEPEIAIQHSSHHFHGVAIHGQVVRHN